MTRRALPEVDISSANVYKSRFKITAQYRGFRKKPESEQCGDGFLFNSIVVRRIKT